MTRWKMRDFVGIDLDANRRRTRRRSANSGIREKHDLGRRLFQEVHQHLETQGRSGVFTVGVLKPNNTAACKAAEKETPAKK